MARRTTYHTNINSAAFRLDTARHAPATDSGIAAIEPAVLHALLTQGRAAGIAALAALTETQLVIEAIDYAAWLDTQGTCIAWGVVLAGFEAWIAAAPTTEERAVCAVLDTTADDAQALAAAARTRGDAVAATQWQRASNASRRALQHYRAGVRPEQLPRGTWIVRSQRPDGQPHLMWWTPDGWQCSCKSGTASHWATALVEAICQADALLDDRAATPRYDQHTTARRAA